MEKKELEKLLKEKTVEQVINKYIYGEIYLTNFQLDKLLKLLEKKELIKSELWSRNI